MNQRTQQKTATQMKILAAAQALFIDQGYEQTTTRAIAQAAEVSVGSVFAHFADKPALLKAILHHQVAAEQQQVAHRLQEHTSAFEALYLLAERLFAFYGQQPVLSQTLLAHGLLNFDDFEPQLQAYLGELAARLVAVDGCPGDMAPLLAQNMMANYFMQLVLMLHRPQHLPEHLAQLRRLCQPLQAWLSQIR